MVACMAGFASNDACMKSVAGEVPICQARLRARADRDAADRRARLAPGRAALPAGRGATAG